MTVRSQRDVERRIRAVRMTCNNPRLRRRMLWLRAMEKGDIEIARDLERVEPGLSEWGEEVESVAQTIPRDRDRAEFYGRLSDEQFAALEIALDD